MARGPGTGLALAALAALLALAAASDGKARAGAARPIPALAAHMAGCAPWNIVYWPQLSFWAEQLWRRQLAVDEADAASVARLQRFAHQAAFFTCVSDFDPRQGTTWSDAVASYFREVAASESLDMPKLTAPELRSKSNVSDQLTQGGPRAVGHCIWWTQTMFCDLGWWSKTLRGNKDYGGGICWDKLQHPGYVFTSNDLFMQILMPHHVPMGVDQRQHPEFSECMEHGINHTVIDSICPLGGYLEDGVAGVPHWGDGVPAGQAREEVDACRAKAFTEFMGSRDAVYDPSSPSIQLW